MLRPLAAAFCALLMFSQMAISSDRSRIGYGELLTNDLFGDTHDRWRTGSYANSRVWGPEWTGQAPAAFGQLLELRFNGEIIAPENVAGPVPGDRPFAGILSLGLHTHFQPRLIEYSVGADIVLTGPMTQLDEFQGLVHDVLGGNNMSPAVRAAQVGNDVNPTVVMEAGREFSIGQAARLRPFVEARAGLETLIRAGADLTVGRIGQGELLVRDPVTGHRYRAVEQQRSGYALVLGADIARVTDSELISSSRGLSLTDARSRVRAGLHWQGKKGGALFYGLTWLDQEFTTQRDEQIVGSLRLKLNF